MTTNDYCKLIKCSPEFYLDNVQASWAMSLVTTLYTEAEDLTVNISIYVFIR